MADRPGFTPIRTARLLIRNPVIGDMAALTGRRNDPEVARYQDWRLPFSSSKAEAIVRGSAKMGGPIDQEWWMATIVEGATGEVIGDLAVQVTWGGRAAEIGYSLDRNRWGRGYATEAVAALLDYLFDDYGILRASASLHPDNVASAQVLERSGFLYEGRSKLSFWEGDTADAEVTDGLFYGLVSADRRAWLDRPTGSPTRVRLVEITAENRRAALNLATHKSQERLVADMATSFTDALFPAMEDGIPVAPLLRAIEADGVLAGFAMIVTTRKRHNEPYLWRLLIDRRHQRRGIGGRALDQLEDLLRADGAKTLLVDWVDGRGSPGPFYLARGFVPTGERPNGEVEARKQL